jgi:hypothetical protein
MDQPAADANTQDEPAPFVWRWLFRTVLGAPIWFVLFGLLSGFGDGLWWKALLMAAVFSVVTHAEDEWRERRSRRRA